MSTEARDKAALEAFPGWGVGAEIKRGSFKIGWDARGQVTPDLPTDQQLWDFADDLLEAWNIEDTNPPSLSEQFRDMFLALFNEKGNE